MNLTRQQEAEARKVYEKYWDSYSKGDLETFSSTLDESFELIGTSESEVCHSKAEGIEFYKSQMQETVGRVEMRNRSIAVKPVNGMFLVNETCDIYVLSQPEWIFYSKIRLSTLLHEIKSGWKVIQQHGSFPDMRVQEGETMAFDKISKENLELRDAIKRATVELENKNRELAIEAALEKVRAVAMGMKKPEDMLAICRTISEQLLLFGVTQIRNIQTALIDEEKGIYLCYQYFAPYEKEVVEKTEYLKSTVEHGMVRKMLASENAHFTNQLTGKELEEFREHRKAENHFPDPLLDEAKELSYCFLSIGQGGLGLTLYQPLDGATLDLFKRFHQVFSLAYQRFRDIKKSEARAREIEIDLALERVRAQTMAMHNSEDVGMCILKMFGELTALGVDEGTRFGIGILNEDNENIQLWTARKDGEEVKMHIGNLDMTLHPLLKSARKAWKEQVLLHQYVLEGEDLLNYYQMINNAPDYKLRIAIDKLPDREFHYGFVFDHGFFYAFSLREFQPELIQITQRFSSLFGQTYRRYLDLVKAEGQAREAEIELALERVRARTMAMQKSDELPEAANVLFQQVQSLGMPAWSAGYCTWDDDKKNSITLSMSSEGVLQPTLSMPLTKDPSLIHFCEAWERGESFFVEEVGGDELKKHYTYLRSLPGVKETLDDIEAAGFPLPTFQVFHLAYFSKGFLLFITYQAVPEAHDIFKRFANVFEQTYTRFLDLQKAEAQTREAQIEVAVERVRAKALAMHHSKEILGVAVSVRDAMAGLDIPGVSAATIYLEQDNGSIRVWDITELLETEEGPYLNLDFVFRLEEIDPKLWVHRIWNSTEKYFVVDMDKDDISRCESWLRSFDVKNADNYLNFIETAKVEHLWQPTVQLESGRMNVDFLQPPPAEMEVILPKMGAAFDLAYKRFLDLQKAEAQTREAQIEAALEKVRSRSLAMHKSEELNEVVSILFEKIKELKIPATSVGIAIYIEDSKDLNAFVCGENEAGLVITNYRLPWFNNKIPQDLNDALEKQLDFFVGHYSKEEKDSFYKYVIEHIPEFRHLPDDVKRLIFESPSYTISMVAVKNAVFNINDFEGKILAENEMDIIKRFARVFDQAYTRFLDLQKAEAQAREAQIEAALERVRSRTMAMQSSSELGAVAAELFAQMNQLVTNLWTCGFVLCEKKRDEDEWWLSMDGDFTRGFFLPNIGDYAHATLYEGWLKGDALRVVQLDGETLQQHYDWLMEIPVSRAIFEEMDAAGLVRPDWQKLHAAYFSKGYLVLITREPCGEEEIFKRFAQVFDQTYTRFLDLQKAETQAREARIEVALERTRTQSMLMQHSDEIKSISNVFHEQLLHLGIPTEFSYVWLPDEANQSHQFWASWSENEAGKDTPHSKQVTYPLDKTEAYTAACFAAWANPDVILEEFIPPSDIAGFFGVWQELLAGARKLKAEFFPEGIYYSEAYMRYGCFGINIRRKLSAEEKHILKRFSKEFERAYTRFLDLQKAEAQAREAQIELGLERVRARAMAMQESGELSDLVATLLQELTRLDFSLTFCIINVYNVPDNSNMVWAANPEEGKAPESYYMKFEDYPFHHAMMREWKTQTPKFVYIMEGEEKAIYDDYLYTQTEFRRFPEEVQRANRALDKYVATFVFSHFGGLQTVGTEPLSDESIDILYRFGKVFDLTYTRFNDLQKAEAQAREAKIEAALERVRSRSMAMHKSEELRSVVSTLYGELQSLQVNFHVVAIHLIPDNSKDLHLWLGTADGLYDDIIHWPYINIPVFHELYRVRTTGGILEYTISEADTRVFFDEYFKLDGVPQGRKTATQNVKLIDFTGAYQTLTGIFLMRYTEGSYSPSEKDIIRRFSKVFEQTYTRFLDLQKAEAQALEAIKRASVDRVRAEIASMRTITDLDRIQPLIWNELKILGVPFIRCGVFIMDEEKQEVESFLSTPDGKSIAAFRLSYSSTEQSKKIVFHWQQKQLFKDHMDEAAFTEFTKKLVQQGAVASDEKYVTENRPTDLYLHFLPFLQGMMYVGNTAPLKEDELKLVQNLADAFSTAYARYEDFTKLEAAKAAVDSAMGTLKATQAQLVQQEKLASLGQLTAGIAHEIKNPLNFVNNFTEVSIELMEEALVEIQKHEDQKDKALINHNLEDIKLNLKKVHGHSTRANSIVNSMLMHSRAGTGSPEPTLLNDFIREYCNLAFHGMRAANNPLNVHMILNLDERVKEIPIIAEDFSRVVLNICNNAFDAMRSTPKPMLTIHTQLQKDTVLLQFKDNGPGIPDEIKDKILQPFFTTKKGKEGTGLGLSITNDIVKAHRGELTIDSQPGEGATFIIHLPI